MKLKELKDKIRFMIITKNRYNAIKAMADEYKKLLERYEVARKLYYEESELNNEYVKKIKRTEELLKQSTESTEHYKDKKNQFSAGLNKINSILLNKDEGITPTNKLNQIKNVVQKIRQ